VGFSGEVFGGRLPSGMVFLEEEEEEEEGWAVSLEGVSVLALSNEEEVLSGCCCCVLGVRLPSGMVLLEEEEEGWAVSLERVCCVLAVFNDEEVSSRCVLGVMGPSAKVLWDEVEEGAVSFLVSVLTLFNDDSSCCCCV